MKTSRRLSILLMALSGTIISGGAQAATTLDWQVTVADGGAHNAFTDLIQWKGAYYLCFRHGGSHATMDGDIQVMTSADLKTWTTCGVLDTLGDDRDPHFTATDDMLFVYFGTWDLAHQEGHALPDRGKVRSYFASTQDGKTWSKIQAVYEPGFWLWRVRRHDGVFYSAAYTAYRPKPDMRETRLVKSTDGLEWTTVTTVTKERMAGEADFHWTPSGEVWIISRTGDKAGDAEWFRSDASMTSWKATPTGVFIHSPAIAEWKDRVFIAGRGKAEKSVTRLWEIVGDKFVECITLPSDGDTAYPGLIVDPASLQTDTPAFFISWYSQHEIDRNDLATKYDANVYVGRVTVAP
ncbi:MAG: hypothetical protein WC655_09550 [Candidatus Hydrogenedentales bacterium]